MARVTGLEPATSGVTGRRSNQLSYTRIAHGPRAGEARGSLIGRGPDSVNRRFHAKSDGVAVSGDT